MKLLTTTAIILTLSLTGTAYADNSGEQANNDFWAQHGKLLIRNSNPNDDSFVSSRTTRTGSQPEVGSSSHESSLSANNRFWAQNEHFLVRHSNPTDYSSTYSVQAGNTGSQPEVGSSSANLKISENDKFWSIHRDLLVRNSNPNDNSF